MVQDLLKSTFIKQMKITAKNNDVKTEDDEETKKIKKNSITCLNAEV
jgi:hypothetical protein